MHEFIRSATPAGPRCVTMGARARTTTGNIAAVDPRINRSKGGPRSSSQARGVKPGRHQDLRPPSLAGNVFLKNVFGGEDKDTRQGHVEDMSCMSRRHVADMAKCPALQTRTFCLVEDMSRHVADMSSR